MIPRSIHWKNALVGAVRDPAELIALLRLPRDLLPQARNAAEAFPLRVPRGFVARMTPGDPADPLLRQVLPLGEEFETTPGFVRDPVGDLNAAVRPGVLHKYRGRVLLTVTAACAVHCRYCFRRHYPYGSQNPAVDGWAGATRHIEADPTIDEVILSGGDPLMLDDHILGQLARRLAAIPHVKRLRLHTRLPVVLPERIDANLLAWLVDVPLQTVMVLHVNHPAELDAATRGALARLRQTGIALLNQAVLLRGVNDDPDTLCRLSEDLWSAGVAPYYLHQLDRVDGAAHFEVPDTRALAILERMRSRLSGYLVPRLVRERAGSPYKSPIGG